MRIRNLRTGVAAALALAATAGQAQLVEVGPNIIVDSAGDDILSQQPNDNCTLREAIQAANTNTAVDACAAGTGNDVIGFDPQLAGQVIALDSITCELGPEDNNVCGDLDVFSPESPESLAIVGPVEGDAASIIIDGGSVLAGGDGSLVTVDCSQADRVLHTGAGTTGLALSNLTIRNGCPMFSSQQGLRGGGVRAANTELTILELQDVALVDNAVDAGSSGFIPLSGGGLSTEAPNVTLTRVSATGNLLIGPNTIDVRGAGVDIFAPDSQARTVDISDSDFSNNLIDVVPVQPGEAISGAGLSIAAGVETAAPFDIDISESRFEANTLQICTPDRADTSGSSGTGCFSFGSGGFGTVSGAGLDIATPDSVTGFQGQDLTLSGNRILTLEAPETALGLIARGAGASLTARDLDFGLVGVEGGNTVITGNSIESSDADVRGGGVGVQFGSGNVLLIDVQAMGNSVSSDLNDAGGGGLWLDVVELFDQQPTPPGSVTVSGSVFSGNSASGANLAEAGGLGLRLDGPEVSGPPLTLSIDGNDFSGNDATSEGGSARAGALLIVADNLISQGLGEGGLSLTGNDIEDNDVVAGSGADGGGVLLDLQAGGQFGGYPVSLVDNRFADNTLQGGTGVAFGGGLALRSRSLSQLDLTGNDFLGNSVESLDDAAGGGASLQLSTAQLGLAFNAAFNRFSDNELTGVSNVIGGGLYLQADGVTSGAIIGSQLAGNTAAQAEGFVAGSADGGGAAVLLAFGSSDGAPVFRIDSSEFGENSVSNPAESNIEIGAPTGRGAGLLLQVADDLSDFDGVPTDFTSAGCLDVEVPCVSVVNSTISNNALSVPNGVAIGGGIAFGAAVNATFNNVTVADNQASGGGNDSNGGGIAFAPSATAVLANSIVALNSATGIGDDCSTEDSSIGSLGYNFISDTSGCSFNSAETDQLGNSDLSIDPGLDELMFIGEALTRVRLPLAGSPVIDAGSPDTPTGEAGSCAPVDQVGQDRPQQGLPEGPPVCDIGAVEFVNDLPPVVISPIADQTRGVDDPPFTADLNNVFADPEDGRLFFIAQAESSMVATATVDGSTLIVTPVAPGTTTITVTAFDDAEQDTTISFEFEVQPANGNQPPQVVGGVSDQFLPVRGDSVEVDLNGIFEDPEGDPLFFDASSSNENVVTVEIDNELGILTLIPGEEGIAVVTVFAFDSTGGQTEIRVRSVARGSGGTSSGGGATLGGGSGGGCALSGTASGRTDPLLWLLAGLATLVILRRRASPGRR